MVELTWNEYERFLDKGGKDSAVCLLEGSGTRVDFRAAGSSRIKLGCGFWGKMAEGMLPRIGVENLFKL